MRRWKVYVLSRVDGNIIHLHFSKTGIFSFKDSKQSMHAVAWLYHTYTFHLKLYEIMISFFFFFRALQILKVFWILNWKINGVSYVSFAIIYHCYKIYCEDGILPRPYKFLNFSFDPNIRNEQPVCLEVNWLVDMRNN